ncbi:MAG: DNA adenine methylase [Xenococcus sp. (in: cyanobacteria)]
MQTVKPFLKWAGGRRQLLEKFRDYYPRELKNNKIRNYYEPFLGGGAVYFDIYKKYTINNAFLFDINEELIICYKVIKNEVYDLIDILHYIEIEKEYKELNDDKRKEYYLRC